MKSRTETEMLDLILGTAKDDANIRTVILEGSRANPKSKKDPFQDFDVIYGVTSLEQYKNNLEWIGSFGDLMILQMPDGMGQSPTLDHKFTYLMQFQDGNRIDLNLYLIDYLKTHKFDSQSRVLLDKDNWLKLPPASEHDYFPTRPTNKEFFECSNEFWWVAPYVAKGLWRNDLGYARHMLEHVLRKEVMKMMVWYFGTKTDFRVNPGKYGKHFYSYIEPEFCDLLKSTYADANIDQVWSALDNLCALFSDIGKRVALHFGFEYQVDESKKVGEYLKHVRKLDRATKSIY